MKTFTTLIAGVALATASTLVNALDVKPTPVYNPFVPFATIADQQAAMAVHQKMIAQQQRAFAEQHANAVRNAMEAERRFAEQMTGTPLAPAPCIGPVAPFAPFAVPEMPKAPAPFELSELPAAPDMAGLDPQSRRIEMRRYLEERHEAMRKHMQEQRDAAFQERDRYMEQMGLVRPEV